MVKTNKNRYLWVKKIDKQLKQPLLDNADRSTDTKIQLRDREYAELAVRLGVGEGGRGIVTDASEPSRPLSAMLPSRVVMEPTLIRPTAPPSENVDDGVDVVLLQRLQALNVPVRVDIDECVPPPEAPRGAPEWIHKFNALFHCREKRWSVPKQSCRKWKMVVDCGSWSWVRSDAKKTTAAAPIHTMDVAAPSTYQPGFLIFTYMSGRLLPSDPRRRRKEPLKRHTHVTSIHPSLQIAREAARAWNDTGVNQHTFAPVINVMTMRGVKPVLGVPLVGDIPTHFTFLTVVSGSLWWLLFWIVASTAVKTLMAYVVDLFGFVLLWILFLLFCLFTLVYGFAWFAPGRAKIIDYNVMGIIPNVMVDVRALIYRHAPMEAWPNGATYSRTEVEVILNWRDRWRMICRRCITDEEAQRLFGWSLYEMIPNRAGLRILQRPVVAFMSNWPSWGSMRFIDKMNSSEVHVSSIIASSVMISKFQWKRLDPKLLRETVDRLAPVINIDSTDLRSQTMLANTVDFVFELAFYRVTQAGHDWNQNFVGAPQLPW